MQPNPRMPRLDQQQTSGTRFSGMVKAPPTRECRDTMQHIVYLLSNNMIREGLQLAVRRESAPLRTRHRRAKTDGQHLNRRSAACSREARERSHDGR
jgi:hypothetical protein